MNDRICKMKWEITKINSVKGIDADFLMVVNEQEIRVIYGKHEDGYFCSIPDWGYGCYMTHPTDVKSNIDFLEAVDMQHHYAECVAEAIDAYFKNKN